MLKLKLKKYDYDFLDGVAHDIFDFSSGIEPLKDDVFVLFNDVDQWNSFDADYSSAIVHYGMTPGPEYEITAIGNRMEYIHDKYFGMLIKH